ncbi:UDP-N-acetylhexosamine pyrophosphorylase [Nasonia vitripennis]|uniref:UDP-N-acetylglucosamine diphosphorylase n=1 Tax=Nasonia vitripennis TaxID=7425 RepID=A0A7M7G7M0_NASVI|nr:UDP-N-acetylhexosamine pyrophosphorylase [Nasonia vitripennis]
MSYTKLKTLLEKHNQEHLLQFWDNISEKEQELLVNELTSLNIPEITSIFHRAKSSDDAKEQLIDNKIKPIPPNTIESIQQSSSAKLDSYENIGLQEIADGKVAVILLAGGQGTRLGVDFPKGMFNIKLPSERTLFHLQALRIKSLQNLAKRKLGKSKDITWYIMTSDATHDSTVDYFETNDHFGLDKNNIIAFKQGTLPCFKFDGKIILDDKYRISKAPDGNGGLYTALKNEGIINDMKSRGINSVHAFSVDNILVKVADPVFLGFCISRSADCGVKVVKKRSADEPVGVVCQVDQKYRVVEYSEILPSTAELQNDKGELVFNAGNICNHYFTVSFLDEIANKHEDSLDLHIAKKKIPFLNESGNKIKPDKPNGIKVEKFVFDVFKYSNNFAVWEVIRENEFSALKNSNEAGVDCPSTARSDILNLHKRWLLNAGAKSVEGDVEVCPLVSYNGENLSDLVNNKSLRGPQCLMSSD